VIRDRDRSSMSPDKPLLDELRQLLNEVRK